MADRFVQPHTFSKTCTHGNNGDFTFVCLADTQFGMAAWSKSSDMDHLNPELTEHDLEQKEQQFAEEVVAAINSMKPKPKFAVVCGDLVNSYPSARSEQDKEVATFKKIFSKLKDDIPLVCVCGNHDLGYTPSPADISLFRSNFGPDHFSFFIQNIKFVVMNSQLYEDPSAAEDLAKAHDSWVMQEVGDCSMQGAKHCVVFSHIPPFVEDADEVDGYFVLKKDLRHRLLEHMSNSGVSSWFCGHFHRNAGGIYTNPKNKKKLEVVVCGAVGCNITSKPGAQFNDLKGMGSIGVREDMSGMRIVTVSELGISHRFLTIADMIKARNPKSC
eukprot:m.340314 g.340314  ORF g.340314 m.340314 type:complete len:329 (+) comp19236_c0_seq1:132-1118(+)